jgi:SAM-dependent methyltransferase
MLEIHHVKDDRLRNAYDDLYEERPIRHTDSFYKWILKLLKPQVGSSLLDVACGQGRLVELATKLGVKAYGFDISLNALKVSDVNELGWAVANGEYMPFPDNTFDYLTNIGSLEHYINPSIGVQEMVRVLKPDGKACILLPNVFGMWSTVSHAFHHGRIVDDGQPIQRYAARYEWQDLLEDGGFKVFKTFKYECEFPSVFQDWETYIKNPKQMIRLILLPFLPINLANSFVFICTRAHKPVLEYA